MTIKTFIVDSFTNEPFKGNPAGVCLLEQEIDVHMMQSIASEINLSETAFLIQNAADDTKFSIRFFTPTVEIAFCGHATLASAKIVLQYLGKNSVEFTTHHSLKIEATSEGENIKMLFPLYDTVPANPSQQFLDAFAINKPVASRFAKELNMLLVEVENKGTLLNINPDFVKANDCAEGVKVFIVTSKSEDNEYDFYSRCFCPWIGINEDPVTGAAHTVLAKYWGDIFGKTEMMAWQSSKRGGFMKLNI
ncbi:MAG: PhzF family phenazine biosynthesis isomerase, partial [Gloeobacteraceae cyanobacterium ES-bin-316]|nr:PhzF family phenazine biosynthesis isomerase [Ferruginibacter sp.]